MEQEAALDNPAPRIGRFTIPPAWRWLCWGGFTVVWTAGLVLRQATQVRDAVVPEEAHFSVAKTVHVFGYALYTLLTAWLVLSRTWRLRLLGFVAAHAALTECIQYFTGRGSSPRDVALNVAGILLGVALTWKRWRRQEDRTP